MAEPTLWQAKRGARTVRGEQRRTALLAAAEKVFREAAYDDVRVADIVEAAGTSHGTFYKYFSSKEAVFQALVAQLQDELLGRTSSEWAGERGGDATDGHAGARRASLLDRIEAGNRRYLEVFKRYANIMVTVEYSRAPQLQQLQTDFRNSFVDRVARRISRWQDEGLIDGGIDPYYAAHALGGMVSRFAYVSHVLGEQFDAERAVQQLTRLWANALQLDERKPSPSRGRRAKH